MIRIKSRIFPINQAQLRSLVLPSLAGFWISRASFLIPIPSIRDSTSNNYKVPESGLSYLWSQVEGVMLRYVDISSTIVIQSVSDFALYIVVLSMYCPALLLDLFKELKL